MKVVLIPMQKVKPYENNPRQNEQAVEAVVKSIQEFGFKVPILIDGKGIIVAGHTRFKAALQLGMKEVPCIQLDGLTDEQIRAFRVADNKTAEYSTWDKDLLRQELEALQKVDYNLDCTGFEDWELENLIGNVDDSSFDGFFEIAGPKEAPSSSLIQPSNIESVDTRVSGEVSRDNTNQAAMSYVSQTGADMEQLRKIRCPHCGEWLEL